MVEKKGVTRGERPRGFDTDAGLARATRLFWKRGYDAVGVAELAQSIGTNPPSLYAAFGNKRELSERTIDHCSATQGEFFGWLDDPDAPACFIFVLTAISGSAINGVPLLWLLQDIDLASRGLRAILG
ncbi:MAG: hypothetical protein C0524_04765 [Rhodobacter sp.]|nr:hypothetical protein [Rhodobacter sp.]